MFGIDSWITPYLEDDPEGIYGGTSPSPDPYAPPGETMGKPGDVGPPASAAGNSYGFMMPARYGGQVIDPAEARRIRGNAFIALGSRLLGASAARDPGGALGTGVEAMTQTYQGGLEHAAAMARQQKLDQIAQTRADLEANGMVQEQQIRGTDEARRAQLFQESEQDKAAKEAAMQSLHDQIQQMSPGSPEASRAEALMRGGDQLYGDMQKLYEETLSRDPARAAQTGALQAATDAAAIRGEVAAGVREDPLAAGRRAEAELGIRRQSLSLDQQRLALEGKRVDFETGAGGKPPTQEQLAKEIAAEQAALYASKKAVLDQQAHEAGKPIMRSLDPKNPAAVSFQGLTQPPSAADYAKALTEAQTEAPKNVALRHGLLGAQRGGGAAPPAPGSRYVFNPATGQLEPAG